MADSTSMEGRGENSPSPVKTKRSSNGRTTETPCKKTSSTKAGKSPSEQNDSPRKSEEACQTPSDHTDEVLIFGRCKKCGENTQIGVHKSSLINLLPIEGEHDYQVEMKNFENAHVVGQGTMQDEHAADVKGVSCKHKNMRSPQNFPELMPTKDESDLEIYDEVIELQEKLLAMEAKFAEKQAEWVQLERDYLLCIRAAERGRVEAVKKLAETEVNYHALLQEYQKLQAMNASFENSGVQDEGPIKQVDCHVPTLLFNCKTESKEVEQIMSNDSGHRDTIEKLNNGMKEAASNPPELMDGKENKILRNTTAFNSNNCGETKSEEKDETKMESVPISIEDAKFDASKRFAQQPRNNPRIMDSLRKAGHGSLRNALLKWCQNQTSNYDVDITNFSSSWKSGVAAAALLHSVSPTAYNIQELECAEPFKLFTLAVRAAEDLGVENKLDIKKVLAADTPHWEEILDFVKGVYIAVNMEDSQRMSS